MQRAVEDVLYLNKVDLVLSGHVHAVERSCRVYNYSCNSDGPVYITIGDGGNKEPLAAKWTEQPAWSLFRAASFGHGEITAANATHLQWEWIQNPGLTPRLLDSVWLVKGLPGQRGGTGVTREPVLA